MDYHRQNGVKVKIVRIFNTYGPNMAIDDGRVVSNFIIQALRGTPLTLYGDGSQTRSFCFVSDLVSGLMKMMNSTPESELGPVNLGNPEETTMAQLAELVIELTGSSSTVNYLPLPQDDPKRRRPDISKAKRLLDWQPTVELRDGLLQTIQYFERRLKEQATDTRQPSRQGQGSRN
jgi:UDP-glucuronate decarboxylase